MILARAAAAVKKSCPTMKEPNTSTLTAHARNVGRNGSTLRSVTVVITNYARAVLMQAEGASELSLHASGTGTMIDSNGTLRSVSKRYPCFSQGFGTGMKVKTSTSRPGVMTIM